MTALQVIGGIIFLWLGGEWLVRGSVRLATVLGVRPLVVGLTVVAFGTSSPELAASIVAALKNTSEIVLGNVIGSNLLNIGAILGISGLLYPLSTHVSLLRREIPIMLAAGVLLYLLLLNGVIGWSEGLGFLLLLGGYIVVLYRDRRAAGAPGDLPVKVARWGMGSALLSIGLGVTALTVGARWLVAGALSLARIYGLSEGVLGLTLVALGTSLPELASCLVAAVKKEADLVLGNLIGSSVFNIFAILGVTALIRPITVEPAAMTTDVLMMLALSAVALLLLATGKTLKRWEGGVLLGLYLLYLFYLFAVK